MFVRVRTTPGAKKERVERASVDTFTISVKEPAERNMANTRVREIIADAFSVPLSHVRIITGHRSHTKVLSVEV